jgi:hypothetical protein
VRLHYPEIGQPRAEVIIWQAATFRVRLARETDLYIHQS